MNLGTPEAPETGPVRRYLRQFLSDPRVIDIGAIPRQLLLNLFILPFRPKQSAEAYSKVWMDEGSPLLVHSRRFTRALRKELGDGFHVELGMRYGQPSIGTAVELLRDKGVSRIVAFPLYSQEASSSTGSCLQELYTELGKPWNVPYVTVVPPFYDDAGYLAALAEVARPVLAENDPEHVVFSYHGIPERHVRKADEAGGHCLTKDDCCAAISVSNRRCYRAQCFESARRLAGLLELDLPWTVAFQSRLGRTPWIRPYTDVVLDELAEGGTKRVMVVSGSFVADCLETLEELGIRAQEDFEAKGGETVSLVPSLNDHPSWVKAAADIVRREAPVG